MIASKGEQGERSKAIRCDNILLWYKSHDSKRPDHDNRPHRVPLLPASLFLPHFYPHPHLCPPFPDGQVTLISVVDSWFLWKVPLGVLGSRLYCPGPYVHSLNPRTPTVIPHTASAYSFSSPTPPLPMRLRRPHGYSRFALVPSLSFESRLVIVSGLWRVELGWPASGDPFAVSVVIPLVGMEKALLR